MEPFVEPLDAYHDSTAPADWLESLVKAYVGDGFAADFYRELAEFMDDATQSLVADVLDDTGHAEFAVAHVRSATEADPAVGRPARAVGATAGRRGAGAGAAGRGRPRRARPADRRRASATWPRVGELLARLTQRHSERMEILGLQ